MTLAQSEPKIVYRNASSEVQALFCRRRHYRAVHRSQDIFVSVGIRNSIIGQHDSIVQSSLAKGFNFFSSVETRFRNSFMTL